ncbi:T9SS type A sorting domain-containing protein [Chitinophaga sp. Cy-1792]|uniref:T9SS type A sorting domain-containing protein n=1 Tax=Chitinophaga sp. Cy-1792 TaxID=2608339 RepID=UPI00141ED38C|nr:T9SS type A sorting domain-containing protein [Chitinophaga sp. Cy-1792]
MPELQTLNIANTAITNGTQPGSKQYALKLWNYLSSMYVSSALPADFNSSETQSALKTVVNYGAGNSFSFSNALKYFNGASGDQQGIWSFSTAHQMAEVSVNSAPALLDIDYNSYYLKLDNSTLATYDDLSFNPYLFLRTQLFGPLATYDGAKNYSLVQYITSGNNYRSAYTEYGGGSENYNSYMRLLPHEQVSFSNKIPANYTGAAAPNNLGSGTFTFVSDFRNIPFNQLSKSYTNIRVDSSSGQTLVAPAYTSNSYFVLECRSPFAITNAYLLANWQVSNNSNITVEYSPDNINWNLLYTKSSSTPSDSIPLNSALTTNSKDYTFYLRFSFTNQTSLYTSAIQQLSIVRNFQVSKYFIPQLALGNNAVKISSASQSPKNLNFSYNWSDDFSNNIPVIGNETAPVPAVGQQMYTPGFRFQWPAATDPDNDAIVEYHFQLSDDSLMSYPLNSNFNRYISPLNSAVAPNFSPEITNFLNPGTKYYWHVRAMDSRGGWSNWGPIWSFTAGGPGKITSLDYDFSDDSTITVHWGKPITGNQPKNYQIHVSNTRGFYPAGATLFTRVTDTTFTFNYNQFPFTYINVLTEDVNGNVSTPFDYIEVLAPAVMNNVDKRRIAMRSATENGYPISYTTSDTTVTLRNNIMYYKSAGRAVVYASYLNKAGNVVRGAKQIVYSTTLPDEFAQTNSFSSNDTTITLSVGGKLSTDNNVMKKVSYQYNLYNYYLPAFGPLQKLTLSNRGTKRIDSISIVANQMANFYSLGDISNQISQSTDVTNSYNKSLAIMKLVADNHLYYFPPAPFKSLEIEDPIRMLSSYGYGNCFMIANTVKFINTQMTGDSLWIWGLNGGAHGVAEVKTSPGHFGVIDADREAFYLQLDNTTLASFEDILFDKYLFIRTKHFGPGLAYSSSNNYSYYNDYISNDNYRAAYTQYGTQRPTATLPMQLKPGEQITFDNSSTASTWHHVTLPLPDSTNVADIIANGTITYTPSLSNNLADIFAYSSNINQVKQASDSVMQLLPVSETTAQFVIRMSSSFVMTGGKLMPTWRAGANAWTVDFSKDSINWSPLISRQNTMGIVTDTIDLAAAIDPTTVDGTYLYYLRFTCNATTDDNLNSITNIFVQSNFQVSKFFIPQLKLGSNSLRVKSYGSDSHLAVKVEWKENNDNDPLPAITSPVFPLDGATVDSSSFTFRWTPPALNDDDSIADYQFQLSEDPTFTHTLSPNFNLYIAAKNQGVNPYYTPEVTDFLLPNKQYYWRVRSLDSRGAWSSWSQSWKFTINKPGTVLNIDYNVLTSSTVQLTWSANPVGTSPVSYYIMGSSERGFYPSMAVVVGTTSDTSFQVPIANYNSYYRIVAADAQGNLSTPSTYVTVSPAIQIKAASSYQALSATIVNTYNLSYQSGDTSIVKTDGSGNIIGNNPGLTYVIRSFINDLGYVVRQEKQIINVTPNVSSSVLMNKWAPDNQPGLANQLAVMNNDASSPAVDFDFTLSPNPSAGNITLRTDKVAQFPLRYNISDNSGRIVKAALITSNTFSLQLSDLQQGSYFFSVIGANGAVLTKKFILIK